MVRARHAVSSPRSTSQRNTGVVSIPKPLPLIVWRDIFVLVDNGLAKAADYELIEAHIHQQAAANPGGLACLVIIPVGSTPPADDVRRTIKGGFQRVARYLRCTCWLVEGTGFRAATVRAALAGLRLFIRVSHPTHITDNLEDAIGWMLMHLGAGRDAGVAEALRIIRRDRALLSETPPPRS
jgi:hypothetical protein